MAKRLIDDAFRELEHERAEHRATLAVLRRVQERVAVYSAAGLPATAYCRLCHDVPMGIAPAPFRTSCPCREINAHLSRQQTRLLVSYERATVGRSADATALAR